MAKDATERGAVVAHPSSMRRVPLGEVLVQARSALREIVVGAGFQVLTAMLEEDRQRLCGRRYEQTEGRRAYRHGSEEAPVVLGGRKVRVKKLRVRSATGGGEITLPTWEDVTREDPLEERAVEQMLLGVSTRRYARSLEPLPPGVESMSVSRSSVSRRFVARTAAKVEEFLSRPLEADFPVVMVDGTGLGEHVLVVALGIDSEGHKHVLGVVEGSTESHGVCQALLRDLIDRGLVVERARLFVIDGGKGLRKAIRETFAQWALIQRCQVHKLRNILDHLPGTKRATIADALRKAWSADSEPHGRQQLEAIASRLEGHHPGAVSALREGLDETLTLLALGSKGGALHRTLCSTNPIENLQGALKRVAKRVKRWRGGSMALRWAATALMEAETRFRRIRGHRELVVLNASLLSLVADPIRKSA